MERGSIEAFKKVVGESWRPMNFNVKFPAKYNLDGNATVTVQSAGLPGKSMGVVMMYYKGKEIKIPGDVTYNDWSVTFVMDKDHKMYRAMELWSNAVYDDFTGARGKLSDLKASIEIELLGDQNQVVSKHILHGVFPVSFDELSADQTMSNTYGTFSMSFAIESKQGIYTAK